MHVAIIMDGNGRWATRRGLPRAAGHRAGVAAVRRVVERAPDIGIRHLTLYAFSADNWSRPPEEVESIFWLMRAYLRLEARRLQQRGVRFQAIGRRDRLPRLLVQEIEEVEAATATGECLNLQLAVDYSSRDAISRSVAQLAAMSRSVGSSPEFARNLLNSSLTSENGDVDLLIRTGGEKRLSDFLLWESAYAELLFSDRMWPEFDAEDLDSAVADFKRRERRFGGVTALAK